MGSDVRTLSGVPALAMFASNTGSPLVIDTATNRAYYANGSTVTQVIGTLPSKALLYAEHTATETPAIGGTLVQWTAQINSGGGSFASGVYTIPVTGRYRIHVSLMLDGSAAQAGSLAVKINTTQQKYILYSKAAIGYSDMASGEQIFDMTAGDTVKIVSQSAIGWFGDANGPGNLVIEQIAT